MAGLDLLRQNPSVCRVESKALLVLAVSQWSFYGLTSCGRPTRPPHVGASWDDGGPEPERQRPGQIKGGQQQASTDRDESYEQAKRRPTGPVPLLRTSARQYQGSRHPAEPLP